MLGVCCPRCFDKLTPEQTTRFAERQKQIELAKQRNQGHIGVLPPERQARRAEKLEHREAQRRLSLAAELAAKR